MYEVEAKVKITKSVFLRLKEELSKKAKFNGLKIKKDVYYDEPKKAYLRIRDEDGDIVLNIKDHKAIKGIEANVEFGWDIKNKAEFAKKLKSLGIKPTIRKNKKTESFTYKNFGIELNYVNKLGYFLEIEKVVKKEGEIEKTKKDLLAIFKEFGYTQKDFEKRYYLELLEELK